MSTRKGAILQRIHYCFPRSLPLGRNCGTAMRWNGSCKSCYEKSSLSGRTEYWRGMSIKAWSKFVLFISLNRLASTSHPNLQYGSSTGRYLSEKFKTLSLTSKRRRKLSFNDVIARKNHSSVILSISFWTAALSSIPNLAKQSFSSKFRQLYVSILCSIIQLFGYLAWILVLSGSSPPCYIFLSIQNSSPTWAIDWWKHCYNLR